MLERYKKYNLKRTVLVSFQNGKIKEIIPRMPTDIGWKEIDLGVADYYKDYLKYLEQNNIKYIQCFSHQVPTLKTRIILALERFIF